ncbi:hypothetical protein DEO72_LG6g980 [Vigna unguiculata]|uniref:Uncharacterized protein n=1 Tax=Vigna unguiculata TaxID=3917 RepID=A0A4D6M6X4_VIGUN|nr:hypothetical protein DEO72_LG6g980 [Vigna unguiculata]
MTAASRIQPPLSLHLVHAAVSTTANPSRCCHHHHCKSTFITSEQQRKREPPPPRASLNNADNPREPEPTRARFTSHNPATVPRTYSERASITTVPEASLSPDLH